MSYKGFSAKTVFHPRIFAILYVTLSKYFYAQSRRIHHPPRQTSIRKDAAFEMALPKL
jgi:hypothetical protein